MIDVRNCHRCRNPIKPGQPATFVQVPTAGESATLNNFKTARTDLGVVYTNASQHANLADCRPE